MMKAKELNTILTAAERRIDTPESVIEVLLTDSRKADRTSVSLFFAITTSHNNGSRYVEELYGRGVRNFVLPMQIDRSLERQLNEWKDVNFWRVKDVVESLQQIATAHRARFNIPVVGITGSNGKTVVKDWLVQLLTPDHSVASNPRSYNSQIGVPLSVWTLREGNDIALFEAGISQPGEMEALQKVISPTLGIITNIGRAHDENFESHHQKAAEKLRLFQSCDTLIYCADMEEIQQALDTDNHNNSIHCFTWGRKEHSDVRLKATVKRSNTTELEIEHGNQNFTVTIPFIDDASIENVMQCITMMLLLGYEPKTIDQRCQRLSSVEMRLELAEAVNDCLLINDAYSLDLDSLVLALDYMQHEQQHPTKGLIMSDFVQSGMPERELYGHVAELIRQRELNRFVGIGEALCRCQHLFELISNTSFYHDTDEFLAQFPISQLHNETLLLKGARCYHFENIARALQRKSHQTVLEVNLDALINNLNYYRSQLQPNTRLMAMVKASSYGAGKIEIASALQYHHVDYLTVAYSDEGVDLRRNGITLPIMVMNPEEESFDDIIRHQLEPDIYSFRILDLFASAARTMGAENYPIHLELDTGMHRLGFGESEIEALCERLKDSPLKVQSIFSHLACSEDATMDDFTQTQIERFRSWSSRIKQTLHHPEIWCHILNSSGIIRFPEAQLDMVRLGIGLYGVAPQPEVQAHLQTVSRLITRISQIKDIPSGDTVGYNRRWVAKRDSRIAILSIGYADGLSRRLGHGVGSVMVGNYKAPIIGSVCMDMCFLDVTDIPCKEDDPVVIFGDERLLEQMSEAAGTIPYEVLTSVSPRVKRVYFQE